MYTPRQEYQQTQRQKNADLFLRLFLLSWKMPKRSMFQLLLKIALGYHCKLNNRLLLAWSKLPYLQVSLAFDSDGSIKVIKICSKQTNFIYFLWDPGSHLCKKLNACVISYVNFDLVFNLYTVHGVLYNICKISTKLNMQCILFTLASESSCILYLLHILHILNMLRKHFLWKYIG